MKLIDKNFFYTTSGYIREYNEFPKKISEEESHFLKELNSKVVELKEQGLSLRKIAEELNITLGKVQRVLKK